QAQETIPASRMDILSTLDILRLAPAEGVKVGVHFTKGLKLMIVLNVMFDILPPLELGSHRNSVMSQLDNRRKSLQDDSPISVTWTQKVRSLVEELCLPDLIFWSDEEESAESDDQFANMALLRLSHFTQRLVASSLDTRLSIAKKLMSLACLLCHCDGSQCSSSFGDKSSRSLSTILEAIVHLLDWPENQVSSELRRLLFAGVAKVVRHHVLKNESEGPDQLANIIFRGLEDKERSVRLSAGNALAGLLRAMDLNGFNVEVIFDRLYRTFNVVNIPIKETLIITVGMAGSNKIDAIKQSSGKSLFSTLGRHLSRVALFLLSRTYTEPTLLTETCRLMAMSPATFVSMTAQLTYPQLFGNGDEKALRSIARILDVSVSALYVQEAPLILAYAFQLQGPGQTAKAIEFVEKIVATDLQGDVKVTLQDLLKSCQVQILAEIIINLGQPEKANFALAALQKFQQAMAFKGRENSQDLATFLKPHTLGVFSQLSDFLQEVKVKVSTERKQLILRSMGALARHVGKAISDYAPQYMSTFQTMILVEELSEVTLETWQVFLTMLEPDEIKPFVGPTTAAFISSWAKLNANARNLALRSLEYLILEIGVQLEEHLDDVVDLSSLPELQHLAVHLEASRQEWTTKDRLQRILNHCTSDNLTVALLSVGELKTFLEAQAKPIHQLASGDVFDPLVGQIMTTLIALACRDGDGTEPLRLLTFECIGILGALDPDRLEITVKDPSMVVLDNFEDEEEAIIFAMHLIRDLLVGVFRATNDVVYQRYLGFTLQELLRVCHFTSSLVVSGNGGPPTAKTRNRWKSLPKHVVETLISLLDSKYSFHPSPTVQTEHPVYPTQSTYREWIQIWTCHLIDRASGPMARRIFDSFPPTVRNKDVVVAYHILPHLVLNILISGHDDDAEAIRIELKTVLEDQINSESSSHPDKKLLSAQAVFMIMDHINKWVRVVRQSITKKKSESKRSRDHQIDTKLEEQLLRVDSILSSIDQNLIAKAAFKCKAYARSLMSFERQIVALQEQARNNPDLPAYYERLHEIYSHLDEPDGMEGVSTLIMSPSLEHQIRQHESTGRWTSAQSCWEVRLQQVPDNVDFHIGLLRCLRNLGHYDTLRTHVKGVLIRHPQWEAALAGFQAESAWIVGAWDEVQTMVENTSSQTSPIVLARLLLAMREGLPEVISTSISAARSVLGAPITAAGIRGYRRSYESVLDLHLLRELETIHGVLNQLPSGSQGLSQRRRNEALAKLSEQLSARFESTLPTYRIREPILSLRRTAFSLVPIPRQILAVEHGQSWLTSAKIARKAGHWQTAYTAMLQATQNKTRFSFFESAKLTKALGEPLRALTELENSMKSLGMLDEPNDVVDLTGDDDARKDMKAKASNI
ncbi:hypothetical protein H0H93_016613, partial [Arthromyces matolae]